MSLQNLIVIPVSQTLLQELMASQVGMYSLQNLSSPSWYQLDMQAAFNNQFSYNDYNSGGCNGMWKNAKFLQAPYITSTSDSITANNTGDAINHHACIYKDTQDTCNFSIGGDGLVQVEYDYEFTGDPSGSWSSFWINSQYANASEAHKWDQNTEIDTLEDMFGNLSHNFAGEGHQVQFNGSDKTRGHVTTYLTQEGAKSTDCASG